MHPSREVSFPEITDDWLAARRNHRLTTEHQRFTGARRHMRRTVRRVNSQKWCLTIALSLALSDDPDKRAAAARLAETMNIGRTQKFVSRANPFRLTRGVRNLWEEVSRPIPTLRGPDGKFISLDDIIQPESDDADFIVYGRGLPSDN